MGYRLRFDEMLQAAPVAAGGHGPFLASHSGTFHSKGLEGAVHFDVVQVSDDFAFEVIDYQVSETLHIDIEPHEEFGITFCRDGGLFTQVDRSGESRPLRGGEIVVTSPMTASRRLVVVPANKRTRLIHLQIQRSYLDRLLREMTIKVPASFEDALLGDACALVTRRSATGLHRMALDQAFNVPYDGAVRMRYLQLKMLEFMTTFWVDVQQDERRRGADMSLRPALVDRLHRARAILLEELSEAPSLRELARRVHLSESALSHGFRDLFDTSVLGFVKLSRLERGCEMLMSGGFNVTQVSHEVGYSSPSRFARDFKSLYGVMPRNLARPGQQAAV